MKVIDDAFNTIKEATGLTDIGEIQNTFVPRSCPRMLLENDLIAPLFCVSLSFGIAAFVVVAMSVVLTYQKRHTRAIRYAQTEFLWILLAKSGS